MTGFRRGTDVWYYAEAEPDARTAFATHGPKPANQRWNQLFRDDHRRDRRRRTASRCSTRSCSTRDGGRRRAHERGLLTLVMIPDRIDDYEELHADPWPDLIEAIAASGYRNYSGFRRGNHVVYYGEYYPDMATVFGRMGEHGRQRALGQGVRGHHHDHHRPRTATLITADEVYHQD